MKRLFKIVALLMVAMLIGSGCCSYMVMEGSKDQVARRRVLASGNDAAIKAVDMGAGYAAIGIDVGNIEALTERPLLQLGAALLDAAIILGLNEGAKMINEADDDDKGGVTVSGDDNSVTVIQGDDNTYGETSTGNVSQEGNVER
jgi:hypothetical protein